MTEVATCPDFPFPRCSACSEALEPQLDPPKGSPLYGLIGYRCSDCERLFCSRCLKGIAHTANWKAPCNDDETARWAEAILEYPKLKAAIATLTAKHEALLAAQPLPGKLEGAEIAVVEAAEDLAARLSQDDRCDEEQEALCRVVESLLAERAKAGR